jgi:hypothetical protein
MRTLLRHALTGQYYQALGKWTTNPERAYDFGAVARALRLARQTHSPNLEVDLTFNNAKEAASFRLKELFTF